MLELVSYGLTGLAALVIVASFCASSGAFYFRGKRLINLTDRELGLLSQRSGERSTGIIDRSVLRRSVQGVTLHG
jgi:hypothetical protein